MEQQKYPVSTADFERIRREGFAYVDKTAYVYSLVSTGVFYFLGRPRRFGKSLLISTLEAYFRGRKELFRGLAIDCLDKGEWEAYPVLHLNLSGKTYSDAGSLDSLLDLNLSRWEAEYGVMEPRKAVDERFETVILAAAQSAGKRVVVLVDEYDTPLSDSIGNPELQEMFREQLHGFYSVLKKTERHIQFCMLTGVTKFGKVSVFSGLNNLRDISLENEYAGICGVTEEELRNCFGSGVETLGEEQGWSVEHTFGELKHNYDGYHFSSRMVDVYNPYSVLNALAKREIADYWASSGMPTLLSKSLRDTDYDLRNLNGTMVTRQMLDNLSAYQKDPVALFYQTGYLTIKEYDRTSGLYTLGFPNREVERGVLNNVLGLYTREEGDSEAVIARMRDSLRKGRPEEFVALLRSYLAGIPSRLRVRVSQYENYYHTIFYCITSLIGLDVDAEYNTSRGFIDILVKTPDYIYVIELKVNGSAAIAMRQIEKMGYADQFSTDPRRLYLISLGFSKKTANLTSSKIV